MFITDPLTPAELLAELLGQNRCRDNETSRFAPMGHNKDLCPAFQTQIDYMLDMYMRIRTNVTDIQGIRDGGTDVMLSYCGDDLETHRIGLQIKSYKEIEDWKNKADGGGFINKLKAQSAEAEHKGKVEQWYIVLCADAIKHVEQIRIVASEFESFDNVKIVLPRSALAFIELSGLDLMVQVTQLLCAHDKFLERATSDLNLLSPVAGYLMIALTCSYFGDGVHEIADGNLFNIADDAAEFLGEKGDVNALVEQAVSELHGWNFLAPATNGFVIDPTTMTSLCAVYFVVKCQRGNGRDMVEYLAALLRVRSHAHA